MVESIARCARSVRMDSSSRGSAAQHGVQASATETASTSAASPGSPTITRAIRKRYPLVRDFPPR